MILEKYHTGKVKVTSPPSSYTRLANRFLKDCKEVLGDNAPDEVEQAAKEILLGREISYMENAGGYPRSYYFDGIYWTRNWEWHFSSFFEDDQYVLDYYFFASDQYDTTYCGVKHTAGDIDLIRLKICRQKGPLRYFCMHRPPSPGGIPDGYVTYEYQGKQLWNGF